MIPAKKDVIFYNTQYSMMEHYLNDVVVKELIFRVNGTYLSFETMYKDKI